MARYITSDLKQLIFWICGNQIYLKHVDLLNRSLVLLKYNLYLEVSNFPFRFSYLDTMGWNTSVFAIAPTSVLHRRYQVWLTMGTWAAHSRVVALAYVKTWLCENWWMISFTLRVQAHLSLQLLLPLSLVV